MLITIVVLNFVSILLIMVGCIIISVIALYFGPCIYQFSGDCNRQLIEGSYASLIAFGALAIVLCSSLGIIILYRLSKLQPEPVFYSSQMQVPMPMPQYSQQQVVYQANSVSATQF